MVPSPVSSSNEASPPKRTASAAGLSEKPQRPVKRRASKACQCCRARKVRCNVVEHGAPCTNCRLDEVECVVTESKRKRKSLPRLDENPSRSFPQTQQGHIHQAPSILDGIANLPTLANQGPPQKAGIREHVPHSLYRTHSDRLRDEQQTTRPPIQSTNSAPSLLDPHSSFMPGHGTFHPTFPARLSLERALPYYLKPVPSRLGADEVAFLEKKGALSVPETDLRNELCRAYVEFVHPYMPVLNLQEFLQILQKGDGSLGRISLLVFQAVMFAGSAFVDIASLRRAGFATRKDARKEFFQRVRRLYDFDYDMDRFSQVQALLLMTSWYETSDDKKDAWHWMGIAVATSYTIGLHRDPTHSTMELKQQRQWKRVWWSCVIRDRLIALGMRRPIRIKPEDCDVPMLTLDDFEIGCLPDDITCIPQDCAVARDVEKQKQLATMCLHKAKLSLCMGEVLAAQYSIHGSASGNAEHDMRAATVMQPKSQDSENSTVAACQQKLEDWLSQLPEELGDEAIFPVNATERNDAAVVVHRAVLHMIYFATLGALHRPQVLHGSPAPNASPSNSLAEMSRQKVQHAATETTRIAKTLLDLDFARFLPTTGVTVLQPAIINHLLDIKSPDEEARRKALQGFCQCIQVMSKLRDCYTAADHSVALVEAAIRRADIKVPADPPTPSSSSSYTSDAYAEKRAVTTQDLIGAGVRQNLITPSPSPSEPSLEHAQQSNGASDDATMEDSADAAAIDGSTPQDSGNHDDNVDANDTGNPSVRSEVDLAHKLEVLLASTPMGMDPQHMSGVDYLNCQSSGHYAYDGDFDSFVNFSGGVTPKAGASAVGMHMLHHSQGMDDTGVMLNIGASPQHNSNQANQQHHHNHMAQFVGSPNEPSMMLFNDMVDIRTPGIEHDNNTIAPTSAGASGKVEGGELGSTGVAMTIPVPS